MIIGRVERANLIREHPLEFWVTFVAKYHF
ncbi:hypothetical protein ES319_D13G215900v1 [Gossypium barbadense]|uniref:Uncharacterized protein n=1 Tax=Gossypium barbadense TaxID=3634 RepID=A0A5J5NQ13_GOSBA|nr:hypothetical protein ES319_D13G215900v1 [Gossypium barbadense]